MIFPDVLHFLGKYLEHHPGHTCTIVRQPTSLCIPALSSFTRHLVVEKTVRTRVVLIGVSGTSMLSSVSFSVSHITTALHPPYCPSVHAQVFELDLGHMRHKDHCLLDELWKVELHIESLARH